MSPPQEQQLIKGVFDSGTGGFDSELVLIVACSSTSGTVKIDSSSSVSKLDLLVLSCLLIHV